MSRASDYAAARVQAESLLPPPFEVKRQGWKAVGFVLPSGKLKLIPIDGGFDLVLDEDEARALRRWIGDTFGG